MADNKIFLAEKAARLLEDLAPYTDEMETEALTAAVSGDKVTPAGQAAIMEALRLVSTVREMKARLRMHVEAGKQAARPDVRRTV